MDTLPQPFSDEIKGIAAVSGIPLGEIFHLILLLLTFYLVNNNYGQCKQSNKIKAQTSSLIIPIL